MAQDAQITVLNDVDYYMESAIPMAVNYAEDVIIVAYLNLCGWMKLLSSNAEAADF